MKFYDVSVRSLLGSVALLLAAGCGDDAGGGGAGPGGGAHTGGAASGGDTSSGGAAPSTGGSGDVVGTGGGGGGAPGGGSTFRVEGRHLHDRCGERVVLRGVNEMIVWSAGKDGVPEFAEIAKTGANSVRIVWNEEGSAAELDAAIGNAVAAELIPMIEHHSATGDLSLLPEVVDYWVDPAVVEVLQKHERYLLLNIANEAGDGSVTADEFRSAYATAIDRIRATGLTLPLIIDAPQWGQDIDTLQAVGHDLIDHDPEKNLLFSVHMWWHDADGTRVRNEIAESVEMGLPLIVGEFSQHAVYQCDQAPFAYRVLLEEAEAHGVGWLAWSWGAVPNNDCKDEGGFDMTTDGTFGNWNEWAEVVAVTDPNSIQNTSVRPASIVSDQCE